jgi:hypothetical protein
MKFPYTEFQIEELVSLAKNPKDWEPVEFAKVAKSDKSRSADVVLELEDGRYVNMRWVITASAMDQVLTYCSALLLENERVRGVDYNEMGKTKMYGQVVIPKGWHQNVIDPNLGKSHKNHNQHLALPDFNPFDLISFKNAVAALWNIKLPQENQFLF